MEYKKIKWLVSAPGSHFRGRGFRWVSECHTYEVIRQSSDIPWLATCWVLDNGVRLYEETSCYFHDFVEAKAWCDEHRKNKQ